MRPPEFREMLKAEVDSLIELSVTKGRDYAGEDDAFANFKKHAAELGLNPKQIWAVYASKHWDAVITACKHAGDDDYRPSEPVDGRIRDLILYLFLLLGQVQEGDAMPGVDVDLGEVRLIPARHAGETADEFTLFQRFLALGPERTLNGLGRTAPVHFNELNKLAEQFDWFSRGRDYDEAMRNG